MGLIDGISIHCNAMEIQRLICDKQVLIVQFLAAFLFLSFFGDTAAVPAPFCCLTFVEATLRLADDFAVVLLEFSLLFL